MRITSIILSLASLVVSASFASEPEWHHQNLQAADGTEVRLDYLAEHTEHAEGCLKCPTITYAVPAWLNVRLPDQKPNAAVRVAMTVFMKYQFGLYETVVENRVVDLDAVAGKPGDYTGPLAQFPVKANGYGGNYSYKMKLSLVVDGDWKSDPVSRSTNFEIRFE
ncbi:MAG: hypothetical protein EOP09_04680 [Proteobacteria bacterium]|nr:MAG: hypothetical protein EOP09_04680 [Pseudomonadota bacterium]